MFSAWLAVSDETDNRERHAMNQNGTRQEIVGKIRQMIGKIDMMRAGFVAAALVLVVMGAQQPFLVSRIVAFVLAAIICVAPFVFLAVGRKRDEKEQALNADAQEKRQGQTRREILRMMKADVETLRLRVGANDDPEARRKAVTQYVNEEILPQVSHAIIASERSMWLQEAQVHAQTLLDAPVAQPTQVLIDACLRSVAAAGWDAATEGDGVVVQSNGASAYLQCLHAETPIDVPAVDAFLARLKVAQLRRGAIVAHQAYTAAALQHARAHGIGLIRPSHVPTFLDWAARAAAPVQKSA